MLKILFALIVMSWLACWSRQQYSLVTYLSMGWGRDDIEFIEKTVSAFTLATSTDSSACFKDCKDCWTKNKNNRLAGTLTLTLDTIFSSEFSIFAMCFGSISIVHMRWIKWLSRVCANHVWLNDRAHLCFDIASAYCILHLHIAYCICILHIASAYCTLHLHIAY